MSLQKPVAEGYYKMDDGLWKITANHVLAGVRPKMVDWWWDNINTTERYQLWHPVDHVSFEWLVSPEEAGGHIGAVHRVQEYFNGTPPGRPPLTLEIRWEDPAKATDAEYAHLLLATGTGEAGTLNATLMHEYETIPNGTRMRSHFWLSGQAPKEAVESLYEHNKQEMANLPNFLPNLFYEEVELPALLDSGYLQQANMRLTKVIILSSSGKPSSQYRLWSNWEEQTYSLTASSPSTLIHAEHIPIQEWSWHPNSSENVSGSLIL